jgi:FAD synthase
MKVLSILLISLTLLSCSCSKKSNPVSEVKSVPPQTGHVSSSSQTSAVKTDSIADANYRLVVSFYSTGEGAEGQQISKFETFVGEYGQKFNKTVAYEKSGYGREGEVSFCLKLSEFSKNEQAKFISDSKDVLKSAKWVHFTENTTCPQMGRRR